MQRLKYIIPLSVNKHVELKGKVKNPSLMSNNITNMGDKMEHDFYVQVVQQVALNNVPLID